MDDKYDSGSGLSQDEYRRFLELRKEFWNKDQDIPQLEPRDYRFMIECLETIAESRANKIEELEEDFANTYYVPND